MSSTFSNFIEIENIGPLKKARVDIREITLITGPNNSGKSTITQLIFIMQNAISDFLTEYYHNYIENELYKEMIPGLWDISNNEIKQLRNQLVHGEYSNVMKDSILGTLTNALDISTQYLITELNDPKHKKRMYDFILNSIEKILGDTIDNIIRHNSKYGKISYSNKKYAISIKLHTKNTQPKKIDELIKFELTNIQVNPDLSIKINDHNEFTYEIRQDKIYLDNFMISNNYLESKFIRSFFYQLITYYRTSNLNYIPPSRSLILQNIHYFSSEKFQSSQNMRINDLVLNFIQNLNESLSKKPFAGDQKEHLEYFFNQILGGRINVDWEYSRRKIEFVENEIITPIERSASMVQELSSIPLLLSGSGPDEIIIEEPEAHLHPIAQLEFVKWLVMYINYETTLNRNVNVILTSHSPIITAQLDNILVATELLGNRTNKIFNETQLISKEVVNMYLLKQDDDGFISDLNPIDRDGFDRDVFGEVNKLLYEEYGEIIELSNEE